MLLQSGQQHLGVDHVYHMGNTSTMPPPGPPLQPPPPTILASDEVTRYLDLIQDTLKDGWTVHATKEGRLYYCNHITRTASWLPPAECWTHNIEYPYGWEKAIDGKGRPYYVNHLNKTTTYEVPICSQYDSKPPEPRLVVLNRCPKNGFGFVAGSERPVIVRYVTPDGPSVNHLQPNDQILAVNGEDVKDAPRDHVIQLVRSCETQVNLLVCQPEMLPCSPGRKSTLLSPARKEKLRNKRPSRVRFAESVCVNGAPLFPPSAFSLGDLHVPQMANVLKVFLENGQTKSFKYDSTTTVRDVVTSLRDKLCLSADEHFSLVLEHVKSLKRNKLTLLDPDETLARIAARPGAHKLRCLFRVTFVPLSAAALAQNDLNSLDYLYMQCCNDVTVERFSPELQPDVALRLAALQIHQHSLANNISPAKLTVKTVEREFGLERFVPVSLMESMKRKELRRLIGHFLKLNQQMTGSSKMLTQLQAKIHYLDIISGLPSYGAKCFSTNARDGIERVLLVSPRFGLSQIPGIRNSVPQTICSIESLSRLVITREDDITHTVNIYMQPDRLVSFMMEDRDALEFTLVLVGYHKLLTGKQLLVDRQLIDDELEEIAPPFLTQHSVLPSTWNYLPQAHGRAHNMLFVNPPPYHAVTSLPIDVTADSNQCDSNMNTTLTNNNNNINHKQSQNGVDEFGFDIHSVMTMEILEGTKGKPINGLIETRNEEVLRRVAEMQKMVENSEKYLNEQGELVHECEMKTNTRLPWQNIDFDSDCDSMNSSKQSSNEDAPPPGVLKHSDSLVLLAESINLDLNGITKGLNLIGANGFEGTNGGTNNKSQENTPKPQRKVQGLSQLLSDLHSITNDLSQSESDSESVYTPTSSPIRRPVPERNAKKVFRTSFGLHSPDSSTLGPDSKDTNLREYLKLLKEASSKDTADIDLAAKKLSELYGFEIGDDTFIESDPDVIDLTAIPPPQTPDELDSLNPLNAAPTGFGDKITQSDGDLEKFLAQVAIAPPTQKITPAKELTPEEIMSYIIPPPPRPDDDEIDGKKSKTASNTNHHEESLYMNSSKHGQSLGATNKKTLQIVYATVDRKGPFSCCSKTKTNGNGASPSHAPLVSNDRNFELPPRRCELHKEKPIPPERPPKRIEIQLKCPPSPARKPSVPPNTFRLNGGGNGVYYDTTPQKVIPPPSPSVLTPTSPNLSTLPPRKPNLPPVPVKPVFRNPIPLPKMINSDSRIAGIVSPRFQRHNTNGTPEKLLTNGNGCTSPPIQLSPRLTNGHFRFNNECPKENGSSSVAILFSPQMNRKLNMNEPIKSPSVSVNGSPLLESRNGHLINVESLMTKTDLAMAGLLVKLDQIAAQCTAAQSAGGGTSIDEEKFQKARNELTETTLQLVTSSKALGATMSNTTPASLPEHLSACLTALRRITELAQDMTKHTSSPLQTRNIVLKVHDVASSFRELANVQIGPLGAGAQALQAECLSNVLATLIRSLRVFSP